MINLSKLRELNLSAAASAGRPPHLSAASGLVCAESFLYVVADDELHLGAFSSADSKAGDLIRIFPGELPQPKRERKARKPDFEALTLLPASADYPYGALFALGSGSKRNRCRGALLALDRLGATSGDPRIIDLAFMYAALEASFTELNIEGALVSGGELRLLQRGNKRNPENAVIRFHLSVLLDALRLGESVAPIAPFSVHSLVLDSIGGVPLCPTDGAALPNGDMLFTAVSEDTEDSYNDGPCAGAAIGIADAEGNVRCVHQLDHPYKVEGVDVSVRDGVIRMLLVTDADDANIPACLLAGEIPYPA